MAPAAGGNGDSGSALISPDGRYVVFASSANNLVLPTGSNAVSGLTPPRINVYLRDRTNGTTKLVSMNSAGTGGGNGDSWPTGVSSNGQFVLFESMASNLVTNDTNGVADVFVRDMVAGSNLLVSATAAGPSGNGISRSSVLTPDGHYAAFVSSATNLVSSDTNGISDVFVRNLVTGTTVLVSAGAQSTGGTLAVSGSEAPGITPDGRYVVFLSYATNLVSGVASSGEVYVRDLVGGTTTWASADARPIVQFLMGSPNCVSFNHVISADGQYVAFEAATNLSTPALGRGIVMRYNLQSSVLDIVDENASLPASAYESARSIDMTPDGRFVAFVANQGNVSAVTNGIYLWDAQTFGATLVSAQLSNVVPASGSCESPVLDASGRYVAFVSSGTNLVTNALSGDCHVYHRDTQAGVTKLLDVDTNGIGAGVNSTVFPSMTADGRCVAFDAVGVALLPGGQSRNHDVFARDWNANKTELVSPHQAALASAAPDGLSVLFPTAVSSNGLFVAFSSEADNLVPNDTNGERDVFVRDVAGGSNILVSVSTNGGPGNGFSSEPSISGDGRYVAFLSMANNLLAGDGNNLMDVFVRDLQTGTTELVTVRTNGGFGGGATNGVFSPRISGDGRYVLFYSAALDLAPGVSLASSTPIGNVFLRDRTLGTTYALSKLGQGGPATMTPDGRFVAFSGTVGVITSGIYVWDTLFTRYSFTNRTSYPGAPYQALSISPDGGKVGGAVPSPGLAPPANFLVVFDVNANTNWVPGYRVNSRSGLGFSSDGRYLVFATTNAASGAPGTGTYEVFLHDFVSGTNLLVSRNFSSPNAAAGASDSPVLSGDGRFVAYRSAATNCVPNDLNEVPDVFLYDGSSGATTLASASSLGNWSANSRSSTAVVSGDGQTLVFQSWGSDLLGQDLNTDSELFAASLYPSNGIPPFSVRIVGPVAAGVGPVIVWPVVAGKTYSVQFKNQLTDTWQVLPGEVVVVGSEAHLVDPAPVTSQRYYRVQGQ